jgi:hypothetical protein
MFRFPYRKLPPIPAVGPTAPTLVARLKRLFFGNRTEFSSAQPSPGDVPARPFASVRVRGPAAARRLLYALLDTGSQDTLLPSELAERLGVILGGEKQNLKWRGQSYPVEFQIVEFEFTQDGVTWRWRARAGFTSAPLGYALLGQRGCLEFLDATFRGADQIAELEINRLFPGAVTSEPR